MSRWGDIAEWRGPASNNFGDGDTVELEASDAMTEVRGLVVHIAEGSFEGTISWERNPDSDVSSHFVVARDGRCAQLVDTHDRSWCQKAGNPGWLSVENEGFLPNALTSQQCEVIARLLARAHREYGVPLQLTTSPAGRGLGYHSMGGESWGHIACPGAAIIVQLPDIVELARQIISEPLIAEGDTDMSFLLVKASGSPSVYLTTGFGTVAPAESDLATLQAHGVSFIEVSQGLIDDLIAQPSRLAEQIGTQTSIVITDAQATIIGDRVGAALTEVTGLTPEQVTIAVEIAIRQALGSLARS